MLIDVFAGTSDEDPVFEELPARQLGIATHELLSSPGLALNMARGDVIFIEDRSTHAVVLERGGNFCIHIYADHIPVEDIAGLESDVGCDLGGTLDGVFQRNLSLAVPAGNGMDKINEFFDRFRDRTGTQWYYANIYQNLDDDDDETLLNWWPED
ncbi:DUF4265 domain-containing protein [Pseudomonas zeae]|jgi:hypothetical protein|uniref:DUF4265 domain-containing protein n=1 Tax=Pseudomonas TaxID=286 RepID=UPI000D6C00AF|nr:MULTISPECIES: DUF4265 domain-containing protein [Pseudomonas]MBC8999862.1 DUF4265 domain-containing protein [Pseudomonas sp. N40(2020)]PWK45931.1 uncharacterized protein DUF4265 [Pseudomonas sp. OV226]UUT14736.1 DUF4265 domain-containing protein [Pseudomonas zeae]